MRFKWILWHFSKFMFAVSSHARVVNIQLPLCSLLPMLVAEPNKELGSVHWAAPMLLATSNMRKEKSWKNAVTFNSWGTRGLYGDVHSLETNVQTPPQPMSKMVGILLETFISLYCSIKCPTMVNQVHPFRVEHQRRSCSILHWNECQSGTQSGLLSTILGCSKRYKTPPPLLRHM